MALLSEQDFDRLALDGSELIGFVSGSVVNYDVAGYDRCPRVEVAPESLPIRDAPAAEAGLLPEEAKFEEQSYLVRVSGFRRRNIFGPDEIGALFRDKAIAWTDGLGNGLYESLLICRKYGLRHVLEAPILGFPMPFLESEWPAFRESYSGYVQRFVADLKDMEQVYRDWFTGGVHKLIVLWEKDYPLAHFINAYRRKPGAVGEELHHAIGRGELPITPQSPAERAALIKFWNWVRSKHSRVLEIQAGVLHQALGENTWIIANPHELPVLDFEGQARAYEIPAVAVRPLLLDDDLMLRYYVAYFSQLYHDLTGKLPMVSVRMNLSAASPQFVPTGSLIWNWYDQAVRHGAGSFYFWTRDYPTNDDPSTYDGPIPGNPVASTLPRERWDVSLDILGWLSTHKRFVQPQAEVAILIPTDSALLQRREWRRIYTAFSALAEARVFSRFISDRQIEGGGIPGHLRLLLAPELEFLSENLRQCLEAHMQGGGVVLTPQRDFFDRLGQPVKPLAGLVGIDSSLFDAFPLGEEGVSETLERAAETLREQVEARGIDAKSWVFDVNCDNLPVSEYTWLRSPDPEVYFAPWLYEHGSEWIMPYLQDL